ncbi:MAG: antibiotic biosynthesis monooxygenase [Proteobacteria bacterium]|nr:MAG: antibiotic biosynthesis monooxygenase [Pseudomonadota bacterium]
MSETASHTAEGVDPTLARSSDGLHFPSTVTTIIHRQIRAGAEAEYERWMHGITCAAAAFSGYLGTTILRPDDSKPSERTREYTVLLNFATAAHLERWMSSAERQEHLHLAAHLCLDDSEIQTLTGLERWFTLPDRAVSQPPARYKMAALTALGLYPLLLLLTLALRPLIGGLPSEVQILISVVLGVPLMTWAVMPLVTRLFFRWLYR